MRISDGSSDVCSSDLEAFHEWAEQEDGWVADNAETAITEGRADLLRRIDAEKARADAAEKSRRELEALVQERGVAAAISFATKHTALAERIKALEDAPPSATAHLVAAPPAYNAPAARPRTPRRA